MTLPTFRQQAAADFDDVFRNVDEFAETVQFLPGVGGPAQSMVVNVVDTEAPFDDGQRSQRSQAIEVSAGRNPDSPLGGILRPAIGDCILRDEAHDPIQRRFGWTGEIVDSTPDEWVLRFVRTVTTDVGGQRGREVR